jgi:hypothetical protein
VTDYDEPEQRQWFSVCFRATNAQYNEVVRRGIMAPEYLAYCEADEILDKCTFMMHEPGIGQLARDYVHTRETNSIAMTLVVQRIVAEVLT